MSETMACPECGSEEVSFPPNSDPLFACVECGHVWDGWGTGIAENPCSSSLGETDV